MQRKGSIAVSSTFSLLEGWIYHSKRCGYLKFLSTGDILYIILNIKKEWVSYVKQMKDEDNKCKLRKMIIVYSYVLLHMMIFFIKLN